MLFILRQLRRLELRKRSGQYFFYAFGEIVLIMVGILLALQVSEWNQAREDRAEERLLLKRLSSELTGNQGKLSGFLKGMEIKEEGLEQVSLAFKGVPIEDDHQFLENVIRGSLWGWTVQPLQRLVFDEMNNTGRLTLIRNVELRDQITRLYNSIEVWEGTAVVRTGNYASLSYGLVPRQSESDVKKGLSPEEMKEIVDSVLRSDLKHMIIHEQNRISYLRPHWERLDTNLKDVRTNIEAELAD